jgi:outer membrane protein insertion porin family
MNIYSTVPQFLPNLENLDLLVFFDAANIWGVDYDSSLNGSNKIKSSIGIGIDWYTIVGPLNFTLTQPISKDSSDITESFRFNIGTTF